MQLCFIIALHSEFKRDGAEQLCIKDLLKVPAL